MLGDAPFSNISFRNQSDDVKGIIERTTIKSRGGVNRQNLSGQKYLFPVWDRSKTISIHIHTNKTHRVARFTHDRKVADSTPPSNEQRTIAIALCQNRSQDDPPPLSQVTFTQQFKRVYYTLSVPPSVITYAASFCYDLFF